MATIKDRTELWQWDTDQYLTELENVPEVHFADGRDTVTVTVENGTARIPDELLQSGAPLRLWGYDTNHTLWEQTFAVKLRPRPEGYVYTPHEAMSWGRLATRVTALEQTHGLETDKTLSASGMAADAGAVGERLSALDATAQKFETYYEETVASDDGTRTMRNTAYEVGRLEGGGTELNTNVTDGCTTPLIPIPIGVFSIKAGPFKQGYWNEYACYNAKQEVIWFDSSPNADIDITEHLTSETAYIRFTFSADSKDDWAVEIKYIPNSPVAGHADTVSAKKVLLSDDRDVEEVVTELETDVAGMTERIEQLESGGNAGIGTVEDGILTTTITASDVGRLEDNGQTLNTGQTDARTSPLIPIPTDLISITAGPFRQGYWSEYVYYNSKQETIHYECEPNGTTDIMAHITEETAYVRFTFDYRDKAKWKVVIKSGVSSGESGSGSGSGTSSGGTSSVFNWRKFEGVPYYGGYRLPVLQLSGDVSAMTKKNAVTLDYSYRHYTSKDASTKLEGTLTCKWQGSSSQYFPKKNYTIKFDNAFNPRQYYTDGYQQSSNGWGDQKKYCFKANYIDATFSRNIICAKLWGQMVKSRSNTISQLKSLPNGGAIDGFPCMIVLNDKYQGMYTWNIPKDPWMFGMGSGTQEAILCADATGNVADFRQACQFKHSVTLAEDANGETDFSVEYITDKNDTAWAVSSCNTLISRVQAATTLEELSDVLDIESAVDWMLFVAFMGGMDNVVKNYLLCTYDGTKWFFSAYDMDGTLGNYWNGERFIQTGAYPMVADLVQDHALYALIFNKAHDRMVSRWQELRNKILTVDNLYYEMTNFLACIPDAVKRQESILWPQLPSSCMGDINQVLSWTRMRLEKLDKEILG